MLRIRFAVSLRESGWMMTDWFANRENRKWIYGVSLAAVPLLVLYGVIDKTAAPLWIALIGAVIAPATALTHLSPPEGRDSLNVPEELDQNVELEIEEEA